LFSSVENEQDCLFWVLFVFYLRQANITYIRNQDLRVLFLMALAVLAGLPLQAQNTSSQRGSSSGGFSVSGSEGVYYVDEVGIRLAADGMSIEGFIDAETYVLGAMDVLSVEIRGIVPVTYRGMVINSEGYLVIPTLGSVKVGDMLLSEARKDIRALVQRTFTSGDINVTLEKAKPVNVHISGDVTSPGRYTFPANTRVDAAIIYLLVGPEASRPGEQTQLTSRRRSFFVTTRAVGNRDIQDDPGLIDLSMYAFRNVVITHRDGSQTLADLMSYFNNGILTKNPYLRDGDVISLRRKNPSIARVAISGAVRFPFEGDYRTDDDLATLFAASGGYSQRADSSHFIISRVNGNRLENIRVEGSVPSQLQLTLQPNDRIIIPSAARTYINESVWISGEVLQPGNYPILSGESTLTQIVSQAGGPSPRALQSGVYIERAPQSDFAGFHSTSEMQLIERSSDQLIEGMDYMRLELSLNKRFTFVDLRDAEKTDRLILRDGDRIHIPRDEETVLVMGQVVRPGYFPVTQGLSAEGYLSRSGGLSVAADPSRIFVIKAGGREWIRAGQTPIESGDIVFVDRVPYDEFIAKRNADIQERQLKASRYQLIISTVSTLASIVLAYVAVTQ